ncbi:MAG: DsrE family protein [Pseudomonadota bacterium]
MKLGPLQPLPYWLAALLVMAVPLAAAMAEEAAPKGFATGPLLKDYGPHAPVEMDTPLPADMELAVTFDVAKGDAGALNRTLVSAARFINMHAANGVDPENIRAAVVVHGAAVFDMANDAAYARKYPDQKRNPNAELIAALTWQGVDIIICGQSAAGQGLAKSELLPDVTMDLSAMTAHARLQQAGYTLNPF